MRVLITGARAPAALHLARLLDGAGHHVVMADSLHQTVSAASRACREFVVLPSATADFDGYAAAVEQAVAAHRIDLVIPTCEEVFYLAHLDIPLFAPDLALLARAHNKFEFTRMMAGLGLPVPDTRLVRNMADVDRYRERSEAFVFKPVWSRFATDVQIRPGRLTIEPSVEVPWVAQDFVEGDEICVYAFAREGRVHGVACYRPVYRAGHGAGIAFEPVVDADIDQLVTAFAEGTSWTGQVAFDLIRKPDGTLVALECNPRATSGIHFFRSPEAFAAAFLEKGFVVPDVRGLQAVKAALWLYGPWQQPLRIWRDLRQAQDVMYWHDDPKPVWRQLAATWEIAQIALRNRISLTAATTHDIAWNGDQSSSR